MQSIVSDWGTEKTKQLPAGASATKAESLKEAASFRKKNQIALFRNLQVLKGEVVAKGEVIDTPACFPVGTQQHANDEKNFCSYAF